MDPVTYRQLIERADIAESGVELLRLKGQVLRTHREMDEHTRSVLQQIELRWVELESRPDEFEFEADNHRYRVELRPIPSKPGTPKWWVSIDGSPPRPALLWDVREERGDVERRVRAWLRNGAVALPSGPLRPRDD